MKKKFYAYLFLLFSCAFLYPRGMDETEQDSSFVLIKSSGAGGTWYAAGETWAELINSNTRFIALNITSKGLNIENIQSVTAKEATLGFLNGAAAYGAYKGTGQPWSVLGAHPHIRALFGLWPGVLNTVVMAGTELEYLQDLKGKTIATYLEGDATGEIVLDLLQHHGITRDNTRIYQLNKSDAARMFLDYRADALIYMFGYGHGDLREMQASRNIRFLPNDPGMVKGFLEENPMFYLRDFGEEFDAPVVKQLAAPFLTFTHEDTPHEMVYEFTRVWFENLDLLEKVLPDNIPYMNIEDPSAGVPIPLHPGSLKYFEDAGIDIGSYN